MEKLQKQERQSNFELLRIVSMLLIVTYHYSIEAFFIPEGEEVTFNVLFLHAIGFGGPLGVDMFVLISGYFMVNQNFKPMKAVRLWMRCLFVPGFFAVFCLIRGETSIRAALSVLFTPVNLSYWFITSYFLMFLLSDFINAMIHSISRKALLAVIGILAAIYTVLPTCLGLRLDTSVLGFFILLYLIAAYIRLYSPKVLTSKHCLAAGIILHLLCNAAAGVFLYLGPSWPILARLANRMREMRDLTVVICAVLVFCGFKNLDIGRSKIINTLGASTLGVYLVHSNNFTDHMLWVKIMKSPGYLYSDKLVLFSLVAVAAEYLISTAVDMVYLYALEGKVMRCAEKGINFCTRRVARSENRYISQ